MGNSHDLVEQMHFLYVNVVQAKDLPELVDPYVEVKNGNYTGVTEHSEDNQHPVWNSVFAFSKERLQSNLIEVAVKDGDEFAGKAVFDVLDAPFRAPSDGPVAPQWYKLVDEKSGKISIPGKIMVAVWMGTQADEAFPEAWHSDAHSVSQLTLANTRSKVYFSPNFYYLRVNVIQAQDLLPAERGRAPKFSVKIQVGHQDGATRPVEIGASSPVWNEELMFLVAEPFDEHIIITVDDNGEVIGRLLIPVKEVPQRGEHPKLPGARWFNLHKPSVAEEEGEGKKEIKFSGKILLRICIDAGYRVLDESPRFGSDFQPSSKQLRKASIGTLELGILSARNLPPMEDEDDRTTDAYCVAKYGNKWVRTRTLLDTLDPRWNEQYSWEVYDPYTVITVGIFGNYHVEGDEDDARDQRIGKVRIRLSTLETGRIYTHHYPLLVLQPSGLKNHGELHLAFRFTCTAWVNMATQYGRPLLPKMHYVQPISVRQMDWLCHQAMRIVAASLSRVEPPLRREIVEYMLDTDFHMFSLRRLKANLCRIESLLSGILTVFRWFNDICHWKNPLITILVHVLLLIQVQYPALILPNIFLCLFVIGIWNYYQFRPKDPLQVDPRFSMAENADEDEIEEEFDTFPTSRRINVVRMRYDRIRSVAGYFLTRFEDLAIILERCHSILRWTDPRATAAFVLLALLCAVFLKVTPFRVVTQIIVLYWLRHPWLRSKLPSEAVNFFNRVPSKSDMLL